MNYAIRIDNLFYMENVEKNSTLIHSLENQSKEEISYGKFFGLLTGAIVLGIVVGFTITKIQKLTKTTITQKNATSVKKTAGIADKKTFKDQAEGILKEGGINGEGNFHLERPGGESQNVYLTSSVVDLSLYVGKKVRVWGETFKGEKAGWLMDVGLVEVLQ